MIISFRDKVLFSIVSIYIIFGIVFTILVKLKLINNKIEYYSSKGLYNTLKFIFLWVYYIKFYIYTYPDWGWILIGKKNIFGYNKPIKVYLKPLRDLNKELKELNSRLEKGNNNIKEINKENK